MKIDFPRINKKLKKRIRVLKRKLSERRGNLKRVKGYVPVVTKKVDCSDMFKQPKNANISVTYC